MPKKPAQRRDDPEQSKRFIEAAIAAGPDETGEKFERAFKRVARPKPKEPKEAKKP